MRNPAKMCLNVLVTAAAALVLTDCQTVTPASRIAENPVLFNALSPEQKLLVQQGRIREGMSKDAVFLAWGYPASAPMTGQKNGKLFERWVYTQERPMPVEGFGGGWYGDPWCRHGWGPYGGMNVIYVPEERASVTFENGKVTSWESKGY